MSLLGRVLVGIGSYLTEKGKVDEQAARDDLLMRREVALKQLEFQHDDANAATQHANKLDEIAATGAETRRTDLFQGVVADRRDQAKAGRDLQHDITIKGIDFSNDVKLKALEHKYKLNEGAAADARDLQKRLTEAGVTIDHWATTNDGRLMAFNKLGKPLEQTQTSGGFTTPGANDDSGIPGLGGGKPSAPSQPVPQSYQNVQANAPQLGASVQRTQGMAPQAAPAGLSAALAQAGNVYAKASQDPATYRKQYPGMFDAQGNLLPQDQVVAQIKQHFGGQ